MDFRLEVFEKVAQRLSFSRAAEELSISQPAVSKHIKNLEKQYNTKLFHRSGSGIKLTRAGEILLKYTKQIKALYERLEFDLNTLNLKHKGKISIGASTTITQYILPQILASFHQKFPDLRVNLINGNTEQIERALSNQQIDLGIIEGQSLRNEFRYIKFLRDEIVLTARASHPLVRKGTVNLQELKNLPLAMREPGSGTREVILHKLKEKSISLSDLNIEIELGSTEAIKNYILHSDALALISIHSILKELKRNELAIIDINDMEINRYFHFILPKGQPKPTTELFITYAKHYNF